jgi:octaprenyl-diphosphate synthase
MGLPGLADAKDDARGRFLNVAAKLSGLPLVEGVIASKLHSDALMLQEIPQYLLSLGGKRIRPILTLIVDQLFKPTNPNQQVPSKEVIDIAAGIELIHMATLLHDDIIDRSALRRHKTSPFFVYGLPGTLLAGDFLLVRAFALCAHLDTYIIEATELACVELTEGEILETSLQHNKHSIESSLQIAQKKTASLFRLSCETASFLAGVDKELIKKMAAYGEALGIAFQIVDDILDVVSTEEKLGKKPGTDIRERKPSIINVLWLESGDPLAKKLLIDAAEITEQDIIQALNQIKSGSVIENARAIAKEYVIKAQASFDHVVKSGLKLDPQAQDALRALSEYALERME